MAAVHNYGPGERKWGHDYVIREILDGGQKLHVMGWGVGIENGDDLILDNKGFPVRYRAFDVKYFHDPKDMWKATLLFNRRKIICETTGKVAESYLMEICPANCTRVLRVECNDHHFHAYPFPDDKDGLKALFAKLEELTEVST